MIRLSVVMLAMLAVMSAMVVQAQEKSSAQGRWLTEDGEGVIEIFSCADRLCGKLVWLKEPMRDGGPVIDHNNPEPGLRQRPVCGLVMLGGFRQLEANHWGDGWIYDPESGKTYKATMALEQPGQLKLRGYVGIPLFGESQIWKRADPKLKSC